MHSSKQLFSTYLNLTQNTEANTERPKIRINPNGTITEFNPKGKQVAPLTPTPLRMVHFGDVEMNKLINEEYLNLLENGELLDPKTFILHNKKPSGISKTPLRVAETMSKTAFTEHTPRAYSTISTYK